MASIVAVNSAATSAASDQIATSSNELGESDFLMLLVTELMNQDPLDPMSDREFIAQLAQIETMNETTDMNENIATLQMLQAAALVGRGIEAIGTMGEQVEGTVTEVRFVDSVPQIVVDDDAVVNLEDILRIV